MGSERVFDNFIRPGSFPPKNKSLIPEIITDLFNGKKFFLLYSRRTDGFEKNGNLAGAVNVLLEKLFSSLEKIPGKDTARLISCGSAHRTAVTQMGLRLMAYENIVNLVGGFNAWAAAELPLVK